MRFGATTEVEDELRSDLAACFQLAVLHDLHEGIANHFSAMLPDGEHFLVNPFGLHFEEVTASSLLICDLNGGVMVGEGEPAASARNIHAPMHKHLPQAKVVCHTHQPWATALTMIAEGELSWSLQTSCRFAGRVAYDTDYDGVALGEEVGQRLARTVGSAEVLFMGNHGVMAIAPTIAQAWDDLYFLERACQTQVLAMSTGRPLLTLDNDMVEKVRAQTTIERLELGYITRHFAAQKRRLVARNSNFAS
jgi:ribulose-5-phosphate 4-epimerase/fuculose-1-phosphate aldolase